MQLASIRINGTKISAVFTLSLILATHRGGSETREDIVHNGGEWVSRVDDITDFYF